MKKLLCIITHRTSWIFNLFLFATLFMQFGVTKAEGSYNYFTGEIRCKSRPACLHEVTHKYDQSHGMISDTKEFQHSIDVYRALLWFYTDKRDANSLVIYNYPGLGSNYWQDTNPTHNSFIRGWGGYREIMADFVMWADGDPGKCTPYLRDWYDWDYIDVEMEKLGYGRFPKFN